MIEISGQKQDLWLYYSGPLTIIIIIIIIIIVLIIIIIIIIIIMIMIIMMMITIIIIMIIMIIIIFISRGLTPSNTGFDFCSGPQNKDYTFHASGRRVENCSSRYSFLNDERDGANIVRYMMSVKKFISGQTQDFWLSNILF